MMLSFSAGCGRQNSVRRALPGESVGRKGIGYPAGDFSRQSLPLGGRWAGEAGSDEGGDLYPTFPCRKRRARQSPRRDFSPAPLGNPVAPSSVTFGDSFPQGEASGLCSPIRKKRPKSGHVHGPRNSLTTTPLRSTTPKRASGNERAIKGVRACPGALFRLSPEKAGLPARVGRTHVAGLDLRRSLTEPPADHRPPPSPGEFPRPQAGKERVQSCFDRLCRQNILLSRQCARRARAAAAI